MREKAEETNAVEELGIPGEAGVANGLADRVDALAKATIHVDVLALVADGAAVVELEKGGGEISSAKRRKAGGEATHVRSGVDSRELAAFVGRRVEEVSLVAGLGLALARGALGSRTVSPGGRRASDTGSATVVEGGSQRG